MSVTALDLELYQGDTLSETVIILDDDGVVEDVTDLTFTAQIRRTAEATAILATFACSIVDGPSGTVNIRLEASQTLALPVPADHWVWDLQSATDQATPTVRTHFAGEVTMVEEVTR